jgi:prevent-host-death family protein
MSNNVIVSVSNFKTHCLEYIENTHTEHFEYIVTKRNKPVAKLIPLDNETFHFGQLEGTAVIKGDIICSLDIDWETTL